LCGGAPIDAANQRVRAHVVWVRPATIPLVQHQIERVVRHVDAGDPPVPNRQQHRLEGGPFTAGRLHAEDLLFVFPVQVERNESASISLVVESQMLIDEVDLISEPCAEILCPGLQCAQAAQVPTCRAVNQYILRNNRVPAVEFDLLKRVV
jgi:hypothetical protein